MANRIPYSAQTPWGAQVAQFAATLIEAQQLGLRLVNVFNSMAAGGAGPFAAMEAELGMAAGDGARLYTAVHDASVTIDAVTTMPVIDLGQ